MDGLDRADPSIGEQAVEVVVIRDEEAGPVVQEDGEVTTIQVVSPSDFCTKQNPRKPKFLEVGFPT